MAMIRRNADITVRILSYVAPFGGFIAGGWAREVLNKHEGGPIAVDIDVFFRTVRGFYFALAHCLVRGLRVQSTSRVAITLSVPGWGGVSVQLIYPHVPLGGEPDEVIRHFDLRPTLAYIDYHDGELICQAEDEIDWRSYDGPLIVNAVTKQSAAERLAKYCAKGFKFSNEDEELIRSLPSRDKNNVTEVGDGTYMDRIAIPDHFGHINVGLLVEALCHIYPRESVVDLLINRAYQIALIGVRRDHTATLAIIAVDIEFLKRQPLHEYTHQAPPRWERDLFFSGRPTTLKDLEK